MKRALSLVVMLALVLSSASVLTQPTGQVTLRVTLDGQPADALIFAQDRFGKTLHRLY
jgi:hypothetical protein